MQARNRAVARLIAVISTPGWRVPKARASEWHRRKSEAGHVRVIPPLAKKVGTVQRAISITSSVSQNVPDEMSKEKQQQQTSDATNPEEKMLGQLGGIDLFIVHE